LKTGTKSNRQDRRPADDKPMEAHPAPAPDFHGASIINERGEEIPITEAMVHQACEIYIQQWEMAQQTATEN
jgi:hypothetical protein